MRKVSIFALKARDFVRGDLVWGRWKFVGLASGWCGIRDSGLGHGG